MARIAGVNLPLNKRIVVGLTYVYGIGDSTAAEILGLSRQSLYVKLRQYRLGNLGE